MLEANRLVNLDEKKLEKYLVIFQCLKKDSNYYVKMVLFFLNSMGKGY